ncbi:MAG: patatin-like phospholipase family protein, partial [Halanaerobiales bacterium]
MYGLVLEGGGAKGAFHIGAYQALREMNININAITGTSIGALNGAMIVQGDFEEAYRLWYNIKPSKVFDVDDEYYRQLKNLNINRDNIVYLLKKTREIMNNRGIDITKIRRLLKKYINEEKLRNSAMELGIVTISLS